jgi:hypothetical protein
MNIYSGRGHSRGMMNLYLGIEVRSSLTPKIDSCLVVLRLALSFQIYANPSPLSHNTETIMRLVDRGTFSEMFRISFQKTKMISQ